MPDHKGLARAQSLVDPDWLVGGGEMAERIRWTDWSSTALGPRETWPSSMRAIVNLLIGCRFPMALLWGRDLLFVYNDAYREIAAEKHPRALGRSTREIWPEVWHINEPIFAAVLDRGETVYLEDKLFPIDRNGRREDAYFTLCYSPVRADDGTVAGSLVTLLETTRRVREAEALRAERNHVAEAAARDREMLAGVTEHVPAMITIYDPHLKTFHLNAETRRVLGWTDQDANSGDLMALCYPDPSYREEVRRFMESAEPGWREFVVTAKDGSKVTSSWANARLSDSTQIGIGLDLRERKRAESALRDSEQQLLALYERNPAMVVLSELDDGRIVRVNDGFTRMLGFSVDEARGRTPVELGIFPRAEDRHRLVEEVRGKGFVRDLEVTVRSKSGALVIGLLSSTVIIDSRGKERLVTVMADITDRKQAEEELKNRGGDLARAQAAAHLGSWRWDLRTNSVAWSEELFRIFGVDPRSFVPSNEAINAMLHPDDRALHAELIQQALGGNRASPFESRIIRPNGEQRDVLSSGFDVHFDDEGRPMALHGTVLDITDRKRIEQELHQREAALYEEQARFSAFMNNSPAIAWAKDEAGRHVYLNAAYEQQFGVTLETWRGKTDFDLWPEEIALEFRKSDLEVLRTGIPIQRVEETRDKQGRLRFWLNSRFRFQDASGRLFVGGVGIEITELRHAEEAVHANERRLSALVEASSQVLYRMSPDWSEMWELRSRGFLAETTAPDARWLKKYIHPDDQAVVVRRIEEAIRTKSTFEFEHRVLRSDGSLGWTASRAIPVLDTHGSIVEWFGAASDVTDRKRAEIALEEANAKLQEADRRKNEFLAMLSHELRNPLAPVRNSVYILDRAAPGGQQAKRAVTVIDRQVNHMTRLIDDLLDVTRISRGKIRLQKERVELGDLVRRTAEDHRALFERSGVALDVRADTAPMHLHADSTRLAQVISNLLSNAAKFTPPGGYVVLSVEKDGGSAEIRVQDNGAGIAPELVDSLFEPFVQAAQTLDRSRGGLGLGLALVKGLVEMHGGAAKAESDGIGKGATFVVRLPIEEPRRAQWTVVPDSAPGEQARRVLIIEDNDDAAESLKEVLELNEHVVDIASSGPQGVAKAQAFKPDLILCDIGLPGMDGFEVAKAVRRDPLLGHTALVALSGYAGPEDVEKSRAAGFDRHVAKPVDLNALERVLTELPRSASTG